jgi:hypothetical protein
LVQRSVAWKSLYMTTENYIEWRRARANWERGPHQTDFLSMHYHGLSYTNARQFS